MRFKGSGKEVGELPPVECTYSDCQKHFATEKLMKAHKLEDPSHNYCKRCDLDFQDWEDFTEHKVNMMAPWLSGRSRPDASESPKHIVCEFCGQDFKSFGGRRLHRTQNHQAEQTIHCPGNCGDVFFRASNMMAHIEKGECSVITVKMFLDGVLQKLFVKEMMSDYAGFRQRLSMTKGYATMIDAGVSGSVEDESEAEDIEGGGAVLTDEEDEAEAEEGGYRAVTAANEPDQVNDGRLPLTRQNLETWPRLPGQFPSEMTDALRNMSVDSRPYADSAITSRRGGNKAYTATSTTPNSPINTPTIMSFDDAASEVTTTAGEEGQSLRAWDTGNTSRTLFKHAHATPTPSSAGHWSAIYQRKEEEALCNSSINLFHSRFWDRTSPEYDPDFFLHAMTGNYICPFPTCDYPNAHWDSPSAMWDHLRNFHLKTNWRCSYCLKTMRSASALVAHSSSPGRCMLKYSSNFKRVSSWLTSDRQVFGVYCG